MKITVSFARLTATFNKLGVDVVSADYSQLVYLYLRDCHQSDAGGFARLLYESLGLGAFRNSISKREIK